MPGPACYGRGGVEPTVTDADLIASLEAAHYHPLWDRYKRITPVAPRERDQPMHWPWRDFEPLASRAAKEVPIEDVERRAIIMANPAAFEATDRKAVTVIGAPSYTSGVQKWNGTAEIL